MQPQDNEKLARHIYDCFNNHDLQKGMSVVSDDVRWREMSTGTTMNGKEEYLNYDKAWLRAFPDGKIDIQTLATSGEFVIVEFLGRGTHNGPLTTPQGEISPTGKKVELSLCDVLRFRDGKLVEGHTYYDRLSLMQQVGVQASAARSRPQDIGQAA